MPGGRGIDRIMARLSWLVVAWLFAAPSASAEIFKCADKNGVDRYQNFPCAIDSIGSLPSGPPSANSASPPGIARQASPAAKPVAVATSGRSPNASEPRAGMTVDEVRTIWGEPDEIIQDEPRDGRIEIWNYSGGRFVQFSNKHRALVVQR